MADHLNRIIQEEESLPLQDNFFDEQLLLVNVQNPWYANLVNYLATKQLLAYLSKVQREKIKSDSKYYIWDDPYLWKQCPDQIIILIVEIFDIWGMDFICPFPVSHGNSYILLIVD